MKFLLKKDGKEKLKNWRRKRERERERCFRR
jgi:hypothetical protein